MERATIAGAVVAVALAVSVVAARASTATPPIPGADIAKIRALYGSFTRLPTFVPAGEVFISWNVSHPAYEPSYINKSLNITWARDGSELYWSITDARIPGDSTCSSRPQTFSPGWVKRISGHRLVYYAGNHTSGIATCVYAIANGYRFPLDVAVNWDNGPSRPSMQQAEQMLLSGVSSR